MEILHGNLRRTILVVLDQDLETEDFCRLLNIDFNLAYADTVEEALEVMRERPTELSAVIIDVDKAKENDFAFLKSASSDRLLDTIPILIATLRDPTRDDLRCLDEGAHDFVMKPYLPRLTKHRIENAIRVKRSETFCEIEAILRELPSNIFLKDAEGRYVFATHYWHHLETGDDPHWTIRGKTDLDIRKDRENAIKAMETDREIIRTGKGAHYVIEINTDGVQEFMELIKRPLFDDEGNVSGIIALINDVTETELLKRELEKRARTDELTGLNNHRAFDEQIAAIAQGNSFPTAIISTDCDELKRVNDTLGHLVGDEYIRMAATAFNTALPDDARGYRVGGDEFVAILPNTNLEQAEEVVNAMRANTNLFKIEGRPVSISCGVSVIEKGDNPLDAIARADRNMYSDKAARKRARQS